MAYDSPKAAHFDAYRDGVKLPYNDPAGLAARWRAASIVGGLYPCLLRMNPEKLAKIKATLQFISKGESIEIRWAGQ